MIFALRGLSCGLALLACGREALIFKRKDGGALVYLKYDALGPDGEACLMIFNPGPAQTLTVDLSTLPPSLLAGTTVPHDLFSSRSKYCSKPLR